MLRRMKFHRDEYLAQMTFQPCERPMLVELFGPLIGLEAEWARQGASPEELSLVAFDWDWLPVVPCGGETGLFGGPPRRVIEDTPDYRIECDALGRRLKLCKGVATLPLPLSHPVTDMDSWRSVKPLFEFRDERIDPDAVEVARRARETGALVKADLPGGFDTVRALMGVENACLCYYDQPELMADILETLADTACRVLERVGERVTLDQLSVHEDMAGKQAPLVGPAQVEQWIAPYYRRVWDVARACGARLFDMDSDGNMTHVLEPFMDAGLNVMHPMEPAAGMDIVAVRSRHGTRLAIKGGIDKHVLRRTKREIDAELEYKLQPHMRTGMVFGLDHRIPNGTPLANYRHYVDTAREILGLPPRDATRTGWARMSF